MSALFADLGIFTLKALVIVCMLLFLLAGILALFSRGKQKLSGRITIKNLNKKLSETKRTLLEEILPKAEWKKYLKEAKTAEKKRPKSTSDETEKKVFVLQFNGDIKASAVAALREEVNAILAIASSRDEVVVRLESAGGMVHAYGLAAAQLQRIRDKNITLTVTVDKVAASGGYMMASVAHKILAAPFAIIGSIGVIVQLPNFHRLLKEKHIDFEQLTAGDFKRTLTMFGPNTEEGREKLRHEIEEIHHLFKQMIEINRPHMDIQKVSTGEHWLGTQAYQLQLVDDLKTSDDYLLTQCEHAQVFELSFHAKKSLGEKLFATVGMIKQQLKFY